MASSLKELQLENRQVRVKTPLGKKTFLIRAQVDERMSTNYEITIDFMCSDKNVELETFLGEEISLEIDITDEDGNVTDVRHWFGTCIGMNYLGLMEGFLYLQAQVRPFLWFLTQTADCKIFQDKDVIEIFKEIMTEYGFSDYRLKTGSYEKREFCVQYRETDYDFISRLFAEEGIYFFFEHSDSKVEMIVVDDIGDHTKIDGEEVIPFMHQETSYRKKDDHIFEWFNGESMNTGHVSLTDFNFKKPTSDLETSNKIPPKGKAAHTSYEVYDYPGRYRETELGEKLVKVRMQETATKRHPRPAQSNVRRLQIGKRFTLSEHPRESENGEYMITACRHQMKIDSDYDTEEVTKSLLGHGLDFNEKNMPDTYRALFEVMPVEEQFRPPADTPKPRIHGVQTAIVVGPSGKEIYTDMYGRVKVQFHWDRIGEKNENSSCWIRKVEPWTGKGWGMQWVPRIGQEVVVQFEEGDPDRPLITGMLFNNQTTYPPFRGSEEAAATLTSQDDDGNSLRSPLPENMTMMGWTTRSTEGGSASTFHELVFEDKKEQEFVRFQSERDYKQIIKNNAEITVGMEHQSPGDYTFTVYNDRTETVKQGNHTRTVETGDETLEVSSGNRSMTIEQNLTETVNSGNHDLTVSSGDQSVTIGGSQTIDVTGAISITSNQSITLTVGSSTIEMTQTSISISSVQITIAGDATVDVGSPATTVAGDGMLTLTGGVLKLN